MMLVHVLETFGFVLFAVGVALTIFFICSRIEKAILGSWIATLLIYWSKNVTRIYLIQWVLIMWLADFVGGFSSSGFAQTILIMAGVAVATHILNVGCLRYSMSKAASPRKPLLSNVAGSR